MKKMHKVMFRSAPRSVRKTLHELAKSPKPFVEHGVVGRPQYLVQTDGSRVFYSGP